MLPVPGSGGVQPCVALAPTPRHSRRDGPSRADWSLPHSLPSQQTGTLWPWLGNRNLSVLCGVPKATGTFRYAGLELARVGRSLGS